MILLKKEYSGEELCDLERDVAEALDGDYNAIAHVIPTDEYGFQSGRFKVTIEWEE